MRLKSIGVLRGYAMGKTQLSKIADNIEREVDEALEFERNENAKLRDELDRMTEAVEALHSAPLEDQLVQALNDADRLRELVARVWGLFLKHGAVHPCDLPEVDAVRDEMRELGFEVDG